MAAPPIIQLRFAIFAPMIFPNAISGSPRMAEATPTNNSGSEVEKAIKIVANNNLLVFTSWANFSNTSTAAPDPITIIKIKNNAVTISQIILSFNHKRSQVAILFLKMTSFSFQKFQNYWDHRNQNNCHNHIMKILLHKRDISKPEPP